MSSGAARDPLPPLVGEVLDADADLRIVPVGEERYEPRAVLAAAGDAALLEAAAAELAAPASPQLLAELRAGAGLAAERRAHNTRRAYDSDWRVLQAYLRARGQPDTMPVDPLLLVAFIAHEAGVIPSAETRPRAISTIDRRLAAVATAHRLAALPDPTGDQRVRDALNGARRLLREQTRHAKRALELEALEHMLEKIPAGTHAGRRDRAILLLGVASTVRRAELVALDVEHLEFVAEGVVVHIDRSKTDQTGVGAEVAVALGDRREFCAVVALRAWLEGAQLTTGPLFRRVRVGDRLTADRLSAQSVALIVKRWAGAVDLNPALFAAHSLRAGGTSAAARDDHDERRLARLTRHRDPNVLRTYIRQESKFDDTAQVLRSRRGDHLKPKRPRSAGSG